MKALLKGIFWLTLAMAILLIIARTSEMGYAFMYIFAFPAIGFIGSVRVWMGVEDSEDIRKAKDPTYNSKKKSLVWVLGLYTVLLIVVSLYLYFS